MLIFADAEIPSPCPSQTTRNPKALSVAASCFDRPFNTDDPVDFAIIRSCGIDQSCINGENSR
jgi:hypothetical protein